MKVNGIDASYYYAKDLDRATAFYTWLFGSDPTIAFPDLLSEWTFAGGESFGLYKGEHFEKSDGIMFAVDDDSEGNGFILHQRKPGAPG